jgi:tetratricopeptide (TPR) repeat protein
LSALLAAVALGAALPALAEADALYARRADAGNIDAALALYRRALAGDAANGEALFKLLRALHFKGAFSAAAAPVRNAAFDEGRRLGQAFVLGNERALGNRRSERIAALRRVPHAAEVYFWTAACWGQWALGRGKLAAAREGVAGKLRDLAQTVIDLDAGLEEGGGDRVLGRLHHQAPRIPFLTGWVSKEKALVHLRRSYAIAPNNSATRFFLADAILDLEPRSREEALRLLRACRDDPPRPEYLVEDRFYAEEARRRLATIQ